MFDNYVLEGGKRQIDLPYESPRAPRTVEVDVSANRLRFVFRDGLVIQEVPWNPQLLHMDGRMYMRIQVNLIWRSMLQAFDKKVSAGMISLFARPDDFRAPFKPIPPDHWSLYRVTDWVNGGAVANDGSIVFSIHADYASKSRKTAAGRKRTFDRDQINAAVLRAFKKNGPLDENGEDGWRGEADVARLIRAFCFNTTGTEPARSTLQGFAKSAIAAASQKVKTHN